MVDHSVIKALEAALAADPDDHSVRSHLATLLYESGERDQAKNHFETLLKQNPVHEKALEMLARIAQEEGYSDKAGGYQTLLDALQQRQASDKQQLDNAERPDNVTEFPATTGKKTDKLHVVASSDNVTQGPWLDVEAPVKLADVGGMEAVKKRLNIAFLAPLKKPEIAKMYGKSLRGGLMLYGPPGCGKTFIARALAGELGAKFMSIGLSDVLDMWLGESERRLHEIFETARRNSPAVLFFDEIDALGQKRSQLKHSAGRNIVNQLLAEMDSTGSDNRNVFILSATNHPWDVDTALRRPGRFDRVVLVLPPDCQARETILAYQLKDRPTKNLNLGEIAAQLEHFSGADISHLCETAVEYALEDSLTTGNARPVTMADFKQALKEVRASTMPWFETARNYAMFANEGGLYDELLEYIRHNNL